MLLVPLIVLALFAGLDVILPVRSLGKVPGVLTAEVASGALFLLATMELLLLYVQFRIGATVATTGVLAFIAVRYLFRMVTLIFLVGKTRRATPASSVAIDFMISFAVFVGLLYVITEA